MRRSIIAQAPHCAVAKHMIPSDRKTDIAADAKCPVLSKLNLKETLTRYWNLG